MSCGFISVAVKCFHEATIFPPTGCWILGTKYESDLA